MSITPEEILILADRLALGESEVDWRNSVSRAYYAVYHSAQLSIDLCPDNSHLAMGSHERLSKRFDLHGSKGARSIAIVLNAMKKYRHSADYEISDGFQKSLATSQLAQARVLRDKLIAFENCHRKPVPSNT